MKQTPSVEILEKDDKEIVTLLFDRDQRAIGVTDKKYRRYLYTIAYNILKDHQDSEECLNDVYFALWNSIPPHHPRVFKAYLTTLTRRTAIDIYRKRKRMRRIPDEMKSSLSELEHLLVAEDPPQEKVETKILSRLLNDFLANADKDDRTLFVCRYYLCMSVASIAETKRVPKAAINKRLKELKQKLKKELEREGFRS